MLKDRHVKGQVNKKLDRLEEMRQLEDMTMEEFAKEKIGVSLATYWGWLEKGKTPTLNSWLKIKNYLEG